MKGLLVLLLLSSSIYASLPDNNLSFPLKQKSLKSLKLNSKSAISDEEKQFEGIIKKFTTIWSPILKKKFGKELFIAADWQSPSVNASMTRDMKDNPVMKVSGGILRHPDMNADSFIFILCHELGHYMGGAPKAFRGNSEKRSWSSVEGQADYFAASKCLPITFKNMNNQKSIDKMYKHGDIAEANNICNSGLCSRIVLAGLSAGRLFADVQNYSAMPELFTRSRRVAWETEQHHPEPQCRVDTVISGALCDIDPNIDFHNNKYEIGACAKDPKSRPACWFNVEYY